MSRVRGCLFENVNFAILSLSFGSLAAQVRANGSSNGSAEYQQRAQRKVRPAVVHRAEHPLVQESKEDAEDLENHK